MSFGNNLKNELIYQNITCKDFSHRCGIAYSTLLSYVNYKNSLPNVEVAVRFARELGVTVEYLVSGDETNCSKSLNPIFKEMAQLPSNLQEVLARLIHICIGIAEEQHSRSDL